jgi:signal transduction histidine kinase
MLYNRSAMNDDARFARLVSLGCHDLRTPLATVFGFARMLQRTGNLDGQGARFLEMITEASTEMGSLLDELGTAARIEAARWEPVLMAADTRDLAESDDDRITVTGRGATIETEPTAVRRALRAFAIAAVRHGPVDSVTWSVDGRTLELGEITADAAPVVLGEEIRDLASVVGRRVIEQLGGSVAVEDGRLRVVL